MLSLPEQTVFVRRNLSELGNWLGYRRLEARADELAQETALKGSIEAAVRDVEFFKTKTWDSTLRLGLYRAALYALIREMKALAVVETGVLHGLTSAFLLAALQRSPCGKLISIDLPSTFDGGASNQDGFEDTLPPGMQPGWAIGEHLRKGWTLKLGSSRDMLAVACEEVGPLDIFLHDSEHTYSTMTLEFETAWPHIRYGGLLIADNIDCNTAFFDFCRRVNRMPYVAPADPDHFKPPASGIRFGLIKK